MIVDPDFCDHWKTRTLVGLLDGDEAAPIYVLRLWAHCQNRRQDTFANLPSAALKALCRFPGHANKLESSLSASGFIRRDGEDLIVCNWSEYNASLIAAWTNGARGGRPPKGQTAKKTEPETRKKPAEKPRDNPAETHGLTIREDKRRESISIISREGHGDDIVVPPALQTDAVQSAALMWFRHLESRAPDKVPEANSPQMQAFWQVANRAGPERFVRAVESAVASNWLNLRMDDEPKTIRQSGSAYGSANRAQQREQSNSDAFAALEAAYGIGGNAESA